MKRIKGFILGVLVLCIFSGVATSAAGAVGIKETFAPEVGIYHNGNTYLFFRTPATWDRANAYCGLLGGQLVCLETPGEYSAVCKMLNGIGSPSAWTGAYAVGSGYTRTWKWLAGGTIGVMHEPDPAIKDDKFSYIPVQNISWDPNTNEPNSYRSPWDQSVACLEPLYGLNTLARSDTQGFVCEIQGKKSYSVVDTNFDRDDNLASGLGAAQLVPAWVESPSTFNSKDRISNTNEYVPKDVKYVPEFPDNANPQNQYNFKGYRDIDTKKPWEYDFVFKKNNAPLTRLSAMWEKTDYKLTTESKAELFAASQFAYSRALQRGKTVSELLNASANIKWTDIDAKLHRYADGKVTMRTYMHAAIGGFVVEDYMRYDDGSTFSAVLLRSAGGQYIIAYRGTEITKRQSWITDAQMGSGKLNPQFGHALTFYDKHSKKNPLITGHSLGGALAAHVAILREAEACTINSAEGISIPLTLSKNLTTHRYTGNELDRISRYENEHDMLMLDIPRVNMKTNRIRDTFKGPMSNHGIQRLIMYTPGSGEYDVAPHTTRDGKGGFCSLPYYAAQLGTAERDVLSMDKYTGVEPKAIYCGDGDDQVDDAVDCKIVGGNGNDTFANPKNVEFYYFAGQKGNDSITGAKGVNRLYLYGLTVKKQEKKGNYIKLTLSDKQTIRYSLAKGGQLQVRIK